MHLRDEQLHAAADRKQREHREVRRQREQLVNLRRHVPRFPARPRKRISTSMLRATMTIIATGTDTWKPAARRMPSALIATRADRHACRTFGASLHVCA